MPTRELRRTPASFPTLQHEYASFESSASLGYQRTLFTLHLVLGQNQGDTEQLENLVFTLQLVLERNQGRHRAAIRFSIYSPAGSMNGATRDFKQLECLYTEELDYPRHTAVRVSRTSGTETKSDIETLLSTDSSSHICSF